MIQSKNPTCLDFMQANLGSKKFIEYREYIVREIVQNCNTSYMTVEKLGQNWQETFECNEQYVKALKESTRRFLYSFPSDDLNYSSPVFFKSLIKKICSYILPYICRLDKTKSDKRKTFEYKSEIREILFEEFFTSNKFVRGQIERYNKKHEYQLKQQTEPQKRTRKRIGEKIEISVAAEQISKIDAQKFEQQIKKRRKKIKYQAIREKHKQQMEQAVLAQISVISK